MKDGQGKHVGPHVGPEGAGGTALAATALAALFCTILCLRRERGALAADDKTLCATFRARFGGHEHHPAGGIYSESSGELWPRVTRSLKGRFESQPVPSNARA